MLTHVDRNVGTDAFVSAAVLLATGGATRDRHLSTRAKLLWLTIRNKEELVRLAGDEFLVGVSREHDLKSNRWRLRRCCRQWVAGRSGRLLGGADGWSKRQEEQCYEATCH
jgi:hypothetical protein